MNNHGCSRAEAYLSVFVEDSQKENYEKLARNTVNKLQRLRFSRGLYRDKIGNVALYCDKCSDL